MKRSNYIWNWYVKTWRFYGNRWTTNNKAKFRRDFFFSSWTYWLGLLSIENSEDFAKFSLRLRNVYIITRSKKIFNYFANFKSTSFYISNFYLFLILASEQVGSMNNQEFKSLNGKNTFSMNYPLNEWINWWIVKWSKCINQKVNWTNFEVFPIKDDLYLKKPDSLKPCSGKSLKI